MEFPAVCALIKSYDPAAALRLLAKNAGTEVDGIHRGGDQRSPAARIKGDNVNFDLAAKGSSSAYLLRRIARERPDILEAYERGEYSSTRAAAKAAGIVIARATIPSDMTLEALAAQLRRRYADPAQRAELARLLLQE